jgi:hypothetical protein
MDLQKALALPAGPDLDIALFDALGLESARQHCAGIVVRDGWGAKCERCGAEVRTHNYTIGKLHWPAPKYSTDMTLAWWVLEVLREQGYDFLIRVCASYSRVFIRHPRKAQVFGHAEGVGVTALAICKAVLQALAAKEVAP